MSIGDTERTTQNRVIDFFKNRNILDYKYIGNLKDRANKNIREDRLRAYPVSYTHLTLPTNSPV